MLETIKKETKKEKSSLKTGTVAFILVTHIICSSNNVIQFTIKKFFRDCLVNKYVTLLFTVYHTWKMSARTD